MGEQHAKTKNAYSQVNFINLKLKKKWFKKELILKIFKACLYFNLLKNHINIITKL